MEMTPTERVLRTVRFETTDRAPVSAMLDYAAAAWMGMKFSDFELQPKKASEAIEKAFEKMGGWDSIFPSWAIGVVFTTLLPLKIRVPGIDLPDNVPHQIVEQPIMTPEDYDMAIKEGMGGLYTEISKRLGRKYDVDVVIDTTRKFRPYYGYWEKEKKVHVGMGGVVTMPADYFSMSRSLPEFSKDLYRRPEKVQEACDATLQDCINLGLMAAESVQNKEMFIGATRASATFMSEKMFLRYFFPGLKEACEQFVDAGYMPLLHFDNDWGPFLEHFLELPKRKCILELDSFTDIFQAKKVLDSHMCLKGDVPATLLSLGTPTEVESYVKRLMEEVGQGGGFILSSGCSVPYDAKFENVQAMIQAGKKYGTFA